ncbi:hypothetical protein ABIA39_003080 [Nocardia sp. GAS34]|uniref:hypothetical protein n=1 Tax=unclassified Nocardia TaxID=2637762 RepID=UPI003D197012
MENDAKLMEILRGLDDPEAPEWPVGYNDAELAASVGRPAAHLGSVFSTHCAIEPDQDSAEYCRVVVPGPATVCGTRIVVLVSNFSPLVMVAVENPGAFLGIDDARAEGGLDAGDLDTVQRVLAESGWVVIPEELLAHRYDGPTLMPFSGSAEPSWWDRFFGFR